MYTIRNLGLADVPATLAICSTLASEYYPELRFSHEKSKKLLLGMLCDPTKHYLRQASDASGAFAGLLLACSTENSWAERKHCHALVWHAVKPCAGLQLLRDFRRWIAERRYIRTAGFQLDCDLDPGVMTILERVGFAPRGLGTAARIN